MHDHRRWSDDKLDTFHQEFKQHVADEKRFIKHITKAQEENTKAIKQLTKNTAELVETWNSAQSVVRAGSVLGRFGKWLASIAIIGAAYNWLINHS